MSKTRKPHKKVSLSFLVSIIIPVYGRFDLLKKCLDAIPDALGDLSYEVIIIDNASPIEEKGDFYPKAVLPPNTKVIFNSKNMGFPAACNKGFKLCSGALLFFLNSDVILNKGSIEILVRAMDSPGVGVAGMKLLFPSEGELSEAQLKHSVVQRSPDTIQHVGLFTNIHGDVTHMYLGWRADHPRANKLRDVFAVTGAAFMTRKQLYKELGGFDEIYGMGTYEEVDFCMKVKEQHLKIIVEPAAVGIHYTGATGEKFQMAFPLNKNRTVFTQRWYNKLVWSEWQAW